MEVQPGMSLCQGLRILAPVWYGDDAPVHGVIQFDLSPNPAKYNHPDLDDHAIPPKRRPCWHTTALTSEVTSVVC